MARALFFQICLLTNDVSSRFQYEQLNGGSEEKQRALTEIKETVLHRKHLDSSIDFIGKLVFGFEKGPSVLDAARGSGQPLVDDWDCLKTMVSVTFPYLKSHKYATPCTLSASGWTYSVVCTDANCQVRVFESQCGSLTQYGMKHMRAFANICNNGVSEAEMKEASISACDDYDMGKWSPLVRGHSAWSAALQYMGAVSNAPEVPSWTSYMVYIHTYIIHWYTYKKTPNNGAPCGVGLISSLWSCSCLCKSNFTAINWKAMIIM